MKIKKLVMPYFVIHGTGKKEPILAMPGHYRFSVDELVKELAEAVKLGITSILLFGIPAGKDPLGSEAYDENGIIPQAVRAVKKAWPKIKVITDICLCEYTSHGHCGILKNPKSAPKAHPPLADKILNPNKEFINIKQTLELYAKTAVVNAKAGADMVAPSGMMPKQVAAIRRALNESGFKKVKIMGYSAKYASAFYGPFREAAGSAPAFGDRTGYQMSPASAYQAASREVESDIAEGADVVMVKPALAYLDVVREVKRRFPKKLLAVYNVSGEFAMVKAAAERGWIDGEKVILEIMTAFERAGADIIITYHAKEMARILHG